MTDRSSSSWKTVAAEYHRDRAGRPLIVEIEPEHLKRLRRLMDPAISLERAWDEISHAARARYNEAPKTMYDAVVYEMRTYGLSQLKNPNCQRRISSLSAAQLKNLLASLGQYPKVTDEFLAALAAICDASAMSHG